MFQQLTIEDVRDVLFAVTFPERTTLFMKRDSYGKSNSVKQIPPNHALPKSVKCIRLEDDSYMAKRFIELIPKYIEGHCAPEHDNEAMSFERIVSACIGLDITITKGYTPSNAVYPYFPKSNKKEDENICQEKK